MITLQGGPLDGSCVPDNHLVGLRVRVIVAERPPCPISLAPIGSGPVQMPKLSTRAGVYKLTDNESRLASWLGWEDELPDEWPEMTRAMANASDEDILKLMDDMHRQ